jgi:hypothetical protein
MKKNGLDVYLDIRPTDEGIAIQFDFSDMSNIKIMLLDSDEVIELNSLPKVKHDDIVQVWDYCNLSKTEDGFISTRVVGNPYLYKYTEGEGGGLEYMINMDLDTACTAFWDCDENRWELSDGCHVFDDPRSRYWDPTLQRTVFLPYDEG